MKYVDFEVPAWGELAQGPVGWPSYRELVLSFEPRAYWRFEETRGETASDELGDFEATYQGGVTLGEPGAILRDDGQSIALNGMDGYVDAGNVLLDGWSSLTVMGWIYPQTVADAGTPVRWQDGTCNGIADKSGQSDDNFSLSIGDGGRIKCYADTGRDVEVLTSAQPVVADRWQQIAARYDGSELTVFHDSSAAGSATGSGALVHNDNALKLGKLGVWDNWFHGRLDEVAVWDQALSDETIERLFDRARLGMWLGV